MTRIAFLANTRMPTERAHGVQTAHMCAAFAEVGATVELIVPNRKTDITDNPFFYYNIPESFTITRVFCIDLVSWGWVGFMIQAVTFALGASWHVLCTKPDLVYSREDFPLFFLQLFRKGLYFEAHDGRKNILALSVMRTIDGIVTISNGLKKLYSEHGVPEQRLYVAPDAVNLEQFDVALSRNEARNRLGLSKDVKMAFYIGSIQEWKGIETFLEAAAFYPSVQYVVVGGYESQIKKLKAEYPHVIFLGQRPYRELPLVQRAADILVIPNTARMDISSRFTSPLKVFAHMASGVPIVVSDVPALREVLKETDAFFFVPDDAHSLAHTVEYVLSHVDESEEHARSAQQSVQKHSWRERASNILHWTVAAR